MIGRKTLIYNIAEVLISSLILFLVYGLVIRRLGIEALGIYSLVASVTVVAKIADLGVAGGVSRFVSMSRDMPQDQSSRRAIADYIETSSLILALLVCGVVLIGYLPALAALRASLQGEALLEAERLLPLAILSFVLMMLNGIVAAALIGLHRADLKSLFGIAGVLVYLLIVLTMLGRLGLSALLIGQAAQHLIAIAAGWYCLRRRVPLPPLPFRVRPGIVKDILHFGSRLQVLTILAMLFDPIAKYALANLANVSAVGLYEAYSRIIFQIRSLAVAPTQNYVAILAPKIQGRRAELTEAFNYSCILSGVGAALFITATTILTPLFLLFVGLPGGSIDYAMLAFLTLGWTLNILIVPHYWLGISGNILRWNILAAISCIVALVALLFALSNPLTLREFSFCVMVSWGIFATVLFVSNPPVFGLRRYPGAATARQMIPVMWRHLLPNK